MSLFNRVKEFLLGQDAITENTEEILSAKDFDELINILRRVKRVNDVQLREIEREIEQLSAIEQDEIAKIKSGNLLERKKKLGLLSIRRLRKEIGMYENKIEIHNKNIDTHQALISTIEEIKSKEMLGIKEELIMQVIESAAKKDEEYQEVITTASAIQNTSVPVLTAGDKAELEAIENEIFADSEKPIAEGTQVSKKEKEKIAQELEDLENEILEAAPEPTKAVPEAPKAVPEPLEGKRKENQKQQINKDLKKIEADLQKQKIEKPQDEPEVSDDEIELELE